MVLEWNICFDKRKKLTTVSWQRDVISKFNPPPSHCVTSVPCGPCWHPWPLTWWWFTGSPATIFLKLTFSLLLPHTPSLCCSGFWETLAFYSFLSRRNNMIYCVLHMDSAWEKLTELWKEEGLTDCSQRICMGKHSSQFVLLSWNSLSGYLRNRFCIQSFLEHITAHTTTCYSQ